MAITLRENAEAIFKWPVLCVILYIWKKVILSWRGWIICGFVKVNLVFAMKLFAIQSKYIVSF